MADTRDAGVRARAVPVAVRDGVMGVALESDRGGEATYHIHVTSCVLTDRQNLLRPSSMPKSRSATGAAGAPLGAAKARANFPRYQTAPRERGEAGIERIATSWKLKKIKIVVDKINKSSLLCRARVFSLPRASIDARYSG